MMSGGPGGGNIIDGSGNIISANGVNVGWIGLDVLNMGSFVSTGPTFSTQSVVIAPDKVSAPISSRQYRCEQDVMANALLHGVGSALGEWKGTVAKITGAFKASVPALGTLGVEGSFALGASAEVAAGIGSAVSGAGEIAAVGTTLYVGYSGISGAYNYYRDNIGECANIQ